LEGGTQLSVIAAGSRLDWERRILPGESEADLENEFNRIISSAGAHTGDHTVEAKKLFSRPPLETSESAEIVKRFRNASPDSQLAGMSYWADSALAAEAGIPAVLFGPIGHGAHATDEWVSAKSLVRVYEAVKKVIFGMVEPVDSLLI
jgi:acetylornithine deacetylase